MILPAADWAARPSLARLADALGARDGHVRYVGGAVRDTLLGLPVADIDLATCLVPETVKQRIRAAGFRAVPTGIRHGTITAVLPDGPVEVTTLRRDVSTDGRHAEVAFTDDWQEDAARRDFTINALSADPLARTIHDYFGGLDDVAAGRVRFIGDPLRRIAEDHLRILRFFRFHARFGRGAPDAPGLDACTARANDLMTLSRERIAQEMLKLLAVDDPTPTIATMARHGILAPILPEIDADGVERLERLVAREQALAPPGDALRRLSALLPADPSLVDGVAARLRLSNAQRKRLVVAADADLGATPQALAHRIGSEGARDRLLLRADDPSHGLAALAGWTPPSLPLKGGELVGMGLSAGPLVAATLQAIERQWIAEGFPDVDRVLAIARERVAQAVDASR
ncbi:CCA tRNA nucleotidyltransferase [Sphingomonas nostoxanthinifaciens]|uniref:CCA tRNA nucleotidyltransferase n=1 Tax=Sphingomonas nostoxanthinifaciens TaxID=2872652 RepID=UPI001CC1F542|nr:CCA tRNA nucleotidyltransferase [Sphingomonas nostoxanthinifaciens]UAK22983.1 CCA tRNA nucleotidyltransferase [Sphingomonas nostoxanthinifaciens]